MKNRISHSAIRTYSECGRKYRLHYLDRYRARTIHGALLFGGSLDHAMNHLLKTRNLEESVSIFEKSWRYQNINDIGTYLPTSDLVVYAQRDFDYDLLSKDDLDKYEELKKKWEIDSTQDILDDYKFVEKKKKESGINSLTKKERVVYSFCNWVSMRQKGIIMLQAYEKQVLPTIKEVLAIQKQITLENTEGDSIIGYLDFIAEMMDGKRYVMDNKTSYRAYDDDSPMRSQQLIIYYHKTKEEYQLDGVGFNIIYKAFDKNKKKICEKCGNDGSGTRFKTCDKELDGDRCKGEWIVSIDPACNIDIILNAVPEAAENLVIEAFDEANEGIKKGVFNPNLGACKQGEIICQFFKKCWSGSDDDLLKLGKKDG